ncbi:UbiA family prenyltransferase [Nocardioides agariphilus]|jgi:4-hydroxybenzoate polyprenyltransferase|uniref:UbiA family prenyltransferase n=1 Tax=Nocardioides agariphilus TaxID=433664 RepID=A0A930VM85_9ACTN|nr:UbiA family prenyltransferase [Nocardioides agariphilus]MBF4769247.1 UbiA family prenyltransferase [Nocardioides agariphilus]
MWPVHLVRAAHPLHALATALVLAVAALASGRPTREAALVAATVLVGQAVIGWHNDLADRRRDAGHQRAGKPVASGVLEPGTAWFALACGVLLLVPLALANGVTAGLAYLMSVLAALLGNVVLRRTALSWLPWAVSFGLLPAFLSYGGWGGRAEGDPPTILVTVLAALLGVAAHVLLALPDLVDDNVDGLRHLPLRLGLRLGAPRLLWIAIGVTVFLAASLVVTGTTVGLRQ